MRCQKWKLFKEKHIMSSDSKLESSVNSVEYFGELDTSETTSRNQSISRWLYRTSNYKQQHEDQEQEVDEDGLTQPSWRK